MMLTDRELLEAAAKAAGLDIHWLPTFNEARPHAFFFRATGVFAGPVGSMPYGAEWSPLTDDGDALRLAVKLGIEIFPNHTDGETVTAFMVGTVGRNTCESWGPLRDRSADDPYTATRRAIVCAAAQIGANSHD